MFLTLFATVGMESTPQTKMAYTTQIYVYAHALSYLLFIYTYFSLLGGTPKIAREKIKNKKKLNFSKRGPLSS